MLDHPWVTQIPKNPKDSGISALFDADSPSEMPASSPMEGCFQNLKIVQHAGLAGARPSRSERKIWHKKVSRFPDRSFPLESRKRLFG
jgi:hypothetical protein